MAVNLIQFQRLESADAISKEFRDDNVIIASINPKDFEGIGKSKAGFSTKFYSCAVLEKKDSNALQKMKKTADFVAVQGSSTEMCAWAANAKGVDFLLQPFSSEKCFLDIQTANVLAHNQVVVLMPFSDFLRADGFRLAQLIKNAAMCVKLCTSAGTGLAFVSGARNENEMRAAKDLASFAVLLGMKKEDALKNANANPIAMKGGAE